MAINRRKTAARELGQQGEGAAADWYRANGYEVLARNWSCFEGEIDVIARRAGTVVFAEVKTRAHDRFADPALAVDHRKQAKLRRTALRWLADQPWQRNLRFDVVVVVRDTIRVIENAF